MVEKEKHILGPQVTQCTRERAQRSCNTMHASSAQRSGEGVSHAFNTGSPKPSITLKLVVISSLMKLRSGFSPRDTLMAFWKSQAPLKLGM